MELSDEISGDIYVVEVGGKIADEALAQKVARGEVQFTVMQKNLADLKEAEFKNVKVRFLKWLQQYWAKRIPDENERLKFILASYNAGVGHVEDAQRLTEKYGGNPESWEDVSYWLMQKSTQQYSGDLSCEVWLLPRFGISELRQPHT